MEMKKLEQHTCLRIQDIVEKLYKLGCSLLGNKDDAWIMELFFHPGLHRCDLIEWIFTKFGYNIGISGPQHSFEDRVKNLQTTISDFGICRANCRNIVEGTAALSEQLEFWCCLVDRLWLKHKIISDGFIEDSGVETIVTPEKDARNKVSEEFEMVCASVNELCESGHIQHIFKDKLQLLAPDVELEINSSLESNILKDLECGASKVSAEENNLAVSKIYRNLCSNKIPVDEIETDDSEVELNKLEEELKQVSIDFVNTSESTFDDVYVDLKPLISNTKAVDFQDVGPEFLKVESLLRDVLELGKSFPKLESSDSKFTEVNSDLEDLLKVTQDAANDEKYAKTFKLLKEEN